MQKVSIRLPEDVIKNIESFAVAHGMSRSGAIEYFTKFGVGALTKAEQENELREEFVSFQKFLRRMHEQIYASTLYQTMSVPGDAEKFARAKEKAVASANEIFGTEE